MCSEIFSDVKCLISTKLETERNRLHGDPSDCSERAKTSLMKIIRHQNSFRAEKWVCGSLCKIPKVPRHVVQEREGICSSGSRQKGG